MSLLVYFSIVASQIATFLALLDSAVIIQTLQIRTLCFGRLGSLFRISQTEIGVLLRGNYFGCTGKEYPFMEILTYSSISVRGIVSVMSFA